MRLSSSLGNCGRRSVLAAHQGVLRNAGPTIMVAPQVAALVAPTELPLLYTGDQQHDLQQIANTARSVLETLGGDEPSPGTSGSVQVGWWLSHLSGFKRTMLACLQ